MGEERTTRRARVLVVDDEVYLADLVSTALRYEGFETESVGTAAAAKVAVADFEPDLIVLDIGLPDGSGIDLCRELRAAGRSAPVVFLTARDATEDKVAGLTVGGDDYVTKPFSLEELIARVRSVLRRAGTDRAGTALVFADLVIDDDAHRITRAGVRLDLTPTEFALLRYLLVNAGRVLTKRQILDYVWEYDFNGNDGVLQTYISYLRRKVDANGPALIHTVPRIGYVMRLPDG
ncbi:response regulator transcription factor [Millisia brevis]|uniref:response regulator transcription factor n=1 Tax=Millisia brevis TaxID=264148 RepID=UPI00082E41CA|nr:response regulator transcription factor [Millisia brevis]